MGSSPQRPIRYRFGPFQLDPAEGGLSRNGNRVKLQDLPFRLLVLLVEQPGEIISREEVRRRLWPENTFVEFDNSLGVAVRKAREALEDDADHPLFIETVPRRGYRFISPVQIDEQPTSTEPAVPEVLRPQSAMAPWLLGAALGLLVALAVGAALIYWPRRAPLSTRDSAVLGEFVNSTQDSAFDRSIKRAVTIQLSQSPYFTLIADAPLKEAVRDLGRSPEEPLTPALARNVCRHKSAKAIISGGIAPQEKGYVVKVQAETCTDGRLLAQSQSGVVSKDQVLPAIERATIALRQNLGESLNSIRQFDVPLAPATTDSLEALRAYDVGLELRAKGKTNEAIVFFQTAATLDPNFAMSFANLGNIYSNLGDGLRGRPLLKRAFELRANATEPERLYISGRYYDVVTGEIEKGIETYTLWTQIYPNEWLAYLDLANDENQLGDYEQALAAAQEAARLNPAQSTAWSNVAVALMGLNRFDEADAACRKAVANGISDEWLRVYRYKIAFAQGSATGADDAESASDSEYLLFTRGMAAAYLGKLKAGFALFDKAIALYRQENSTDNVSSMLMARAIIETEVGDESSARRSLEAALRASASEDALANGALVLAQMGDEKRAGELLARLNEKGPLATGTLNLSSPMIFAAMATHRGASEAQITHLMQPARPYELGQMSDLVPVYVRGLGYLRAGAGGEAAREFQEILDHRGVDCVSPIYSLSYLQLGRAYKLAGDKEKSRKAYHEFLGTWKEADAGIPILRAAKREYAAMAP